MTVSLVTGGAGFIGSHIVAALVARGDKVRVLDDFSTGSRENLSSFYGQVNVIDADIRDQDAVMAAVKDVELIFHQAAFVSVPLSLQQPKVCFDVNVRGTQNLLEAARGAGVRKVVLASSAAVYGDSQRMPLQEDSPLRSLSPYAAAKQTNEVFADLYTRVYDLPVVALRYFNVFGPRQAPESDYAAVIPIFIRNLIDGERPVIYGDGTQTRDFVFIEDVVKANLAAAEHARTAGKNFNVCTGKAVSILELLQTLTEIFPDSPEPLFTEARRGDIHYSVGDAALLEDVTGFKPDTSLKDGLRITLEWMKS
ncbi:MAG: NAD-dependent epimerase/dehydratase family protein [Chloroflexi bacterium]|nr:NAD-dependent epimerase/dehydratase family protein [Chloroflexota bacterium]